MTAPTTRRGWQPVRVGPSPGDATASCRGVPKPPEGQSPVRREVAELTLTAKVTGEPMDACGQLWTAMEPPGSTTCTGGPLWTSVDDPDQTMDQVLGLSPSEREADRRSWGLVRGDRSLPARLFAGPAVIVGVLRRA